MKREDRAGLYITVIAHLTVIIVLLISQIDATKSRENSFVLDFTKQEEIEKQQKEAAELQAKIERAEQMRAELQKKIDQQLSNIPSPKNTAVNRSGQLKDDRNTDVNQLYKDAQKIQDELKKGYTPKTQESGDIAADDKPSQDKGENKKEAYSGASLVSWQLDGRDLLSYKVPAYKCYGAGIITIMIGVDNAGRVTQASVQSGPADKCIQNAAIAAAKTCKFSPKPDAPSPQMGSITYEFIAQ